MTNDKEKLLEKLQKLFALSKSDNQHEAELALAKANKLMEEHQIGMSEVDLFEDGGSITENDVTIDGVKPYMKNIMVLSNAAAKFYNAKAVRMMVGHTPGVKLRFYGTPTDILAAKETFNYLLNSWKSISEHDMKITGYRGHAKIFKNSHFFGFALAIEERVKELVAQRDINVKAATGRSLVVVKDAALNDYLKNIKMQTVKTAPKRFFRSAYSAGQISGQNIPLSGAIEHGNLMIGKA